jgi:ATP-dependent protease ClpP protease subunit
MKNWVYKANKEEEAPQNQPIFLNLQTPSANEGWSVQSNIKVLENKILFYSDIDANSILELNKLLLEIDVKLQNTKNALGDCFDPVCHLHLCTYGGEIFPAFSTVDIIRKMKSKVYTHVDGSVASAGTLISAIGNKRFMGKHAHLLIHQLSGGMYGKFSEMEDEFYNSTTLIKLIKSFYKETTKIPMKKLDDLLKKDIWLTADECLEFGIIDEIV